MEVSELAGRQRCYVALTDPSMLLMNIMYSFIQILQGLGLHVVSHAVDSDHSVCKINSLGLSGALRCLLLRVTELLIS